jgi:hypothetical protein
LLTRIGEEKPSSLGELAIDERKLRADRVEVRTHNGSLAGLVARWVAPKFSLFANNSPSCKPGNAGFGRRIR